MKRRRLQCLAGFAALATVFSAAAYSSSGTWSLDFAQYAGTERTFSQEDFRFVIVGDRTATPEWGLMPQAFHEINQLSPDFVISVGDLIDGYGDKELVIHQMWQEFDQEVSTLKSPFVYVPGNHDIWNATSRGIYEARYGPSFRSFNYRGLHCITLDTEQQDERGRPLEKITGGQFEWLKSDLARHRGARQILIFMHRPIWETGGLDEIYPLLSGQRVHIFAGHHHRYSFAKLYGIPHVVLSAVAGSLTGDECVETGNFRHYVFASVRGGDLKLALVRLGGVLSPDVTLAKGKSR
jgi:3',5'-cyclic AMP phosphodiesterase CpdA